jgi:sialate O-acetylesterase
MTIRLALLALILSVAYGAAAVRLPEIFASGMVLQKSTATPIWGWADPGTTVRVALGAASAEAKAGPDGKWRVNLDLTSAGPGPHEMTVNDMKLSDVLVGEVWLCGGQSNMEYKVGETLDAGNVIKGSGNPNIRQFYVPRRAENAPAGEVRGHWAPAGPSTTGQFTAVGYYFARALQRELGVPLGLINASWGASAAWARGPRPRRCGCGGDEARAGRPAVRPSIRAADASPQRVLREHGCRLDRGRNAFSRGVSPSSQWPCARRSDAGAVA